MTARSPESQLAAFIATYTPEIAALAEEALARMRARLPGAFELPRTHSTPGCAPKRRSAA